MAEKTIFPREEKADVLFNKILNDPWACEKLQGTFCNSLFCNEDNNFPLSPAEFSQALFNAYHNRDLSAFLIAICQNTLFDLLRNSFLIPYRFNADGRTNPIIMTDESGNLLPRYKTTVREKDYQHFYDVYCDLDNKKNIYFAQAYRYRHAYASEKMDMEQQILEKRLETFQQSAIYLHFCRVTQSRELSEDHWRQLVNALNKVYPTFISKLYSLNPKLTELELRTCCLIKIGISTNRISALIAHSPSAVNSILTRLYHKMTGEKTNMSVAREFLKRLE